MPHPQQRNNATPTAPSLYRAWLCGRDVEKALYNYSTMAGLERDLEVAKCPGEAFSLQNCAVVSSQSPLKG